MKYSERPPAVLLLEDGTRFEGKAIGKIGTSGGEICFNTGMTGYQEVYTDPSYYGQIIVNTNAHIGNYGTTEEETESDAPKISGLVVNTFSQDYSRKIADQSLQSYLERHGVVGISDVDTRQIVRHIRNKGAMNALISSEGLSDKELEQQLKAVPSMEGLELSTQVTTKAPYFVGPAEGVRVAVLDLGVKRSILKNMAERGMYCQVFPAQTKFEDMEKWKPAGYFISNGPGDPASTGYAVDTIKTILEADKPLFGICLGHQLLALSMGVSTYKMHHGHRGLNHPVLNLETGKGEITSQNHGFSIKGEDLEKLKGVKATHVNLNDKTIEGIRLEGKKAFSVQYHPESSPGPHDSRYLFDEFLKSIQS